MNMSITASSAVSSVRTSGVLVTTTPRCFAAATSMLLNPTPKLARMRVFKGSVASTSAVMRSVTVHSRASAVRSACARPATLRGRSSGFSCASNSRATCSSTGAGSRRVTTTCGRVAALALTGGP